MNQTLTPALGASDRLEFHRPFWQSLKMGDWLFAVIVLAAAGTSFNLFHAHMDVYEKGILLGLSGGLIALGWFWKSIRVFFPVCVAMALLAISAYHGDLARGQTAFFLKYMLSSQSAVMWMCVLIVLATLTFWFGLIARSQTAESIGTALTWGAAGAAGTWFFVRWYESYLIGADIGHVPVSNLYEVFIIFCLILSLLYLHFQQRYATRNVGAFITLILSASVGFIVWYSVNRQAHEIQPLVPALQSWWMKIHVPANFVGYGSFSLAAMLGVVWLLATPKEVTTAHRVKFFSLAGITLLATIIWQLTAARLFPDLGPAGLGLVTGFGCSATLLFVVAALPGSLASRLPSASVIEEMSYRAVSFGFLFFTIATILGAMWAADAWGSYWSWDPKETWALIVWLNYAAWLHMRLVKGWRGEVLAWWSAVGLIITTFAFLGVNMYLSGLHSYGKL
jgi:cytochrome c-type biogenesis protein CcsB